MQSMDRFGYVAPMVLNESNGRLLAGHGRLDELKMLKADGKPPPEGVRVKDGEWLAPVVMGVRLGAQAGKAYTIADNRMVELGGWDEPRLVDALISLSNGNLNGTGYDHDDVDQLIRLYRPDLLPFGRDSPTLAERFGVPPFSVLDARQGYWQERKRAWLELGIESELGRGGAPGGSPRPAAQLTASGRTVRGDGRGRILTGSSR